jgi:pimeloyl-ACP methyl ester carboxylesterase
MFLKSIFLILMMHSKNCKRTILLLVTYFGLFAASTIQSYTLTAYSQNQKSSFVAEINTLNHIPVQKIKVGDIDIAYKQLGNSSSGKQPIVLINGLATSMDMWSPTLLRELSSNHAVIIFDNRGVGESTTGTKQFSIYQFANDTIGLLDTLKIRRADILGFSVGSYIAQEIALKNPNRVNSLILYASSCGGKEAIPPRPQVLQAVSTFTNTSLSAQQKIDRITSTLFPSEWFKANPNYQSYIPNSKEPASLETIQKQQQATINWFYTGTCNALSRITQPTLVIVGTDDMWTPPANSLMIAEKIPGASLVQIKGAGHGLMYQFPDKFSKAVSTFLQIAS